MNIVVFFSSPYTICLECSLLRNLFHVMTAQATNAPINQLYKSIRKKEIFHSQRLQYGKPSHLSCTICRDLWIDLLSFHWYLGRNTPHTTHHAPYYSWLLNFWIPLDGYCAQINKQTNHGFDQIIAITRKMMFNNIWMCVLPNVNRKGHCKTMHVVKHYSFNRRQFKHLLHFSTANVTYFIASDDTAFNFTSFGRQSCLSSTASVHCLDWF